MERGAWWIWRRPIELALLTIFGLTAALVGTRGWHWAPWAALTLPIFIATWRIRSAYRLRKNQR